MSKSVKIREPPCTERYARWCERSAGHGPPPTQLVTLFTVLWFCWIHFVVDLDHVCGQKVYVSSLFRQYKIRFLVLLKLRNPLALFNKRCT